MSTQTSASFTSERALLEIGTEELPARFFYGAIEQMERLTEKKLESHRLISKQIYAYGTPRRLVLEIGGLPLRQTDIQREVKGPAKASAYDKEGKPTPALLGFTKGQGVSFDKLIEKEVSGKIYLFALVDEKGKATNEILAQIFPEIIRELKFPKSMKWESDFAFGRPIRWLLSLFNEVMIPFSLDNLQSGTLSFGHRFLASQSFSISKPHEYPETLKKHFVVVDHHTRKELILKQSEALAKEKGGTLSRVDSLLDEVTLLVEYPTPFVGHFDERFLVLPQEVLVTVMQHHQRYFPLVDKNGALMNFFIAVRNGDEEGIDQVRAGNEQVLKARFKDAEYFFQTDKKTKLIDRIPLLSKLVFQKNLGTITQKVERIKNLIHHVVSLLPKSHLNINRNQIDLFSQLFKCDLTTQMVFELPELQGVMGKEYAKLEGYSIEETQMLLDPYLPRFQGDQLPQTHLGSLIGIADRIDTLVGCFAIGTKPSGSSDPLALRRAALTLLQILYTLNQDFDLETFAERSLFEYKKQFENLKEVNFGSLLSELKAFILDRNETLWKSLGINYDTIRVFEGIVLKKPVSALKRAKFLEEERAKNKAAFERSITTWTRVFNILKAKEIHPLLKKFSEPNFTRNQNGAHEEALERELRQWGPQAQEKLLSGDIKEGWGFLAHMEQHIDNFFNDVLVMDPDEQVRNNRLYLLWKLRELMLESFGDLTTIVLS